MEEDIENNQYSRCKIRKKISEISYISDRERSVKHVVSNWKTQVRWLIRYLKMSSFLKMKLLK